MKEFALALDLKNDPETIRRYCAYHEQVWPEVEAALLEVGIVEMKIWLLGNRLFMRYLAAPDFDPVKDMQRYMQLHPKIAEWEKLMGELQQPLPQAKPDERWLHMQEIYHLKKT